MPDENLSGATGGAGADTTPMFAQSANWGAGGSFVFDPATGERITEEEWAQRQATAAAQLAASASTTKTSKGA